MFQSRSLNLGASISSPQRRQKESSTHRLWTLVVEKKRAQILIVDDHPILCQGMTAFINSQDDLHVGATAQSIGEALETLESFNPDLFIVDITLGEGRASGLDLIKRLTRDYPKTPVLVLSMHDESVYAERSIRAGAKGYVMKQEALETLLTAIRTVLTGKMYISPNMAETVMWRYFHGESVEDDTPERSLSNRELEVFEMLGHGKSTRQIAESLSLSIKTIETHRSKIKNKLGIQSGNELVRRAVEWVTTSG